MHWIFSIIFVLVSGVIYGRVLGTFSTDGSGKSRRITNPNLSQPQRVVFRIALFISLTLTLLFAMAWWGIAVEFFVLAFYCLRKALTGTKKSWSRRLYWGYGIVSAILMALSGIIAANPYPSGTANKTKLGATVPSVAVSNETTEATSPNTKSVALSNTTTSFTKTTPSQKTTHTAKTVAKPNLEDANYFLNKYGVNQPYDNVGLYKPDNIIVVTIAPGQANPSIVDDIKNEILQNTGAVSLANGQPFAIDFYTNSKSAQIELSASNPSNSDINYMYHHLYAEYLSADSNGNPIIKFFDMQAANGNVVSTMQVS